MLFIIFFINSNHLQELYYLVASITVIFKKSYEKFMKLIFQKSKTDTKCDY